MEPALNSAQTQQADANEASEQELHLLDLVIVFTRRWRFILSFTVCITISTAVVLFLLPNKYTASTIVLPPGQGASASALLGQLGGGVMGAAAGASLGIKNPGEMYISLLQVPVVEDAVIQRFGLMARYKTKKPSDARTAFERHTKIALGTKDGLITISVTDPDPKMAADIANGYIEEFHKFSAGLAITEASQRRSLYQQQLLEANESLAKSEEALKSTQQSSGVVQIDAQTRILIDSAASLRAQVVAKQVELQGMRAYATEDNPDVLAAKQQLAALQDQLSRLGGSIDTAQSGLLLAKGRLPEAGMEYIRRLRDVKYYETVSSLMARQFEAAKLDEARQGTSLQLVDIARIPDKHSSPQRGIILGIVLCLAFFIACAWCLLTESLARLKSNPEDSKRLDAILASFR